MIGYEFHKLLATITEKCSKRQVQLQIRGSIEPAEDTDV